MAELPKILDQRLRTVEQGLPHPDPDLITAFVERSLGYRERLEVVEHLSRCSDCREVAMLATPPSETALIPSRVGGGGGWFAWPVLRWGAAVACVIVVGTAVTLRHQLDTRSIAPASPTKSAPATQVSEHSATSAALAAPRSSYVDDSRNSLVANGVERTPPVSPNRATTQSALTAGGNEQPAPSGDAAAATVPGSVESADARAGSFLGGMVPGRAKGAQAESQGYTARAADRELKKQSMATAATSAMVTPDAAGPAAITPRWTLSSDGTLQRSMDSGRTWETIQVSSKSTFRALAANGLDIWVGGSAGALFHSVDAGQHWRQVRPVANGEALADDIIGVEFSDLLHGKLTTADTETWLTTDAGQTWQRQ